MQNDQNMNNQPQSIPIEEVTTEAQTTPAEEFRPEIQTKVNEINDYTQEMVNENSETFSPQFLEEVRESTDAMTEEMASAQQEAIIYNNEYKEKLEGNRLNNFLVMEQIEKSYPDAFKRRTDANGHPFIVLQSAMATRTSSGASVFVFSEIGVSRIVNTGDRSPENIIYDKIAVNIEPEDNQVSLTSIEKNDGVTTTMAIENPTIFTTDFADISRNELMDYNDNFTKIGSRLAAEKELDKKRKVSLQDTLAIFAPAEKDISVNNDISSTEVVDY